MHYWAGKEFRREKPERVGRHLVTPSPLLTRKLAAAVLFIPVLAFCTYLLWEVHVLKKERAELVGDHREVTLSDLPRSDVYVHELLAGAGMRSAEKPSPFVPPAFAGFLLFVLHAPESMESHARYEVVLRDGTGRTIWRGRDLVPGEFNTFAVGIPRRLLPAGWYRFSLEGVESSGEEDLLANYDLQVVDPSSPDGRRLP
jgi:hypothetical protein